MALASEHPVVADAVRAVAHDLVSMQHWRDASFVRLPLIYPGGTTVTVKVDQHDKNAFRVSDNGFAFHEIECVGASRSFSRIADGIIADFGIQRNARAVFVDATAAELYRAISDIGIASWQIVSSVFSRIKDDVDDEIVDFLTERLLTIFGHPAVHVGAKLSGASTSEWDVTATVKSSGKLTVFQAVGAHANSIYRANAAFDDLSALQHPPNIVGVVHSIKDMGSKLALLTRSARIIEGVQSDDAYRQAVAA